MKARKLFNAEIQHEREMRESYKEVVDSHLVELNHAAERMDRLTSTFITRREFDQYKSDADAKATALNLKGTEGFRETEAERHGRESATKEILESQGVNRRWLIGLAIGNGITIFALILHLLTGN